MPDISIRPAQEHDCAALADIYNHYIAHTVSTFDEQLLPALEFASRLALAQERALPWFVTEIDGALAGFACANPWKAKSAYRFVVETSVYLAPEQTGRGLGEALYRRLFAELAGGPVRQAVACISLPNPASVALHERLGFRAVGRFERVGFKFERWIDVGYWQLELDDWTGRST